MMKRRKLMNRRCFIVSALKIMLIGGALIMTPEVVEAQWTESGTEWLKPDGRKAVNEWIDVGNGRYYRFGENGKKYDRGGLLTIDGVTWITEYDGRRSANRLYRSGRRDFYCDAQGRIVKNRLVPLHDERYGLYGTYYFDRNGERKGSCWHVQDGKEYWLDYMGRTFRNQTVVTDRGTFFFQEDGSMLKNGPEYGEDGKVYWRGADGERITEKWFDPGDGYKTWYDGNGERITYSTQINDHGKVYVTDEHGSQIRTPGWVRYRGVKRFYVGQDLQPYHDGLFEIEGKKYFFDGAEPVASSWQTVNGVRYYFDEDCAMVTDRELSVDQIKYRFFRNGTSREVDQTTRTWMKQDGTMARNEWIEVFPGKFVRYQEDGTGRRSEGMFHIGKDVYCTDAEGYRLNNAFFVQEGRMYYFGNDGKGVRQQTVFVNGEYYHIKEDGTAAKNEWCRVNGQERWFDESGKMARNGRTKTDRGQMFFFEDGTYLKDGCNDRGVYYDSKGTEVKNRLIHSPNIRRYHYAGKNKAYNRYDQPTPEGYYYFDESSKVVENRWKKVNGIERYFKPGGQMAQNEIIKTGRGVCRFLNNGSCLRNTLKDGFYYLSNGARAIDRFVTIDGKKYYFNKSGVRETKRFFTRKAKKYYNDPIDGIVKNRLITSDTATCPFYWIREDGSVARSTTLKGKNTSIIFGKNGNVIRVEGTGAGYRKGEFFNGLFIQGPGMFEWNGKYYLQDRNGRQVKGAARVGKKEYYFSYRTGERQTGIRDVDSPTGVKYYDPVSAERCYGWKTIGSKRYYFSRSDRGFDYVTPVGDKLYLLDVDGSVLNGFQKIRDDLYFADRKTGELKTGWQTVDGKRYYADPKTGALKRGWTVIGKKKYRFHSRTGELKRGWTTVGKKKYRMDRKTGEMIKGWVTVGKKKYYTDRKTGELLQKVGRVKIEGKYYYLNKDHSVR